MSSFLPRISTPEKEGVLQVSKALKYQVFLDVSEMEDLFLTLENFSIYCVSEVVKPEAAEISHSQFLEIYREYSESLKSGGFPDEKKIRRYFSSVFTVDQSAVYAQLVGDQRYVIKPIRPLIQLQNHRFYFSEVDGKIHPSVHSDASIFWGIQFSYPQIAEDPVTGGFLKATDPSLFPNASLFSRLAGWLRKKTTPTPFIKDGVKMISPIRLGRECFSWINAHPQLIGKGIETCKLK